MTKALFTFVLLNVVAFLTVATLGTISYFERETLKREALELETAVKTVSDNLKWGEEVVWETPEDKKPLDFVVPQPTSARRLEDLDLELGELATFSRQRQAQLSLRYNELVSAQTRTDNVEGELAAQQRELKAATDKKAQLERSLSQAESELETSTATLATIKQNQTKLEGEIATLNSEITTYNNRLATLEIDLETRIQERDLAQTEYEKCRFGAAGGPSTGPIKGKRGKVMAVNSDWEYVVIDKGMVDNVEKDLEALVHRGQEYIGKLKVVRVEDAIAIAEIVSGSLEPSQEIQTGDTLFF